MIRSRLTAAVKHVVLNVLTVVGAYLMTNIAIGPAN
jgi:hypothetical protein